MELFDFGKMEEKVLQKARRIKKAVDRETAKKEQTEIDALDSALNLYEKFISSIYPKIVSKSLEIRCSEIVEMEESENNLDNIDDIYLDIKVPITLKNREQDYNDNFYNEFLLGISLEYSNYEAASKFIDMLDYFVKRNHFYMASIYNKQTDMYIQGTYKQLKDIYYAEMQGLEYMHQDLDAARVIPASKGRK